MEGQYSAVANTVAAAGGRPCRQATLPVTCPSPRPNRCSGRGGQGGTVHAASVQRSVASRTKRSRLPSTGNGTTSPSVGPHSKLETSSDPLRTVLGGSSRGRKACRGGRLLVRRASPSHSARNSRSARLNLLRMGPCDVVRPAFDPDQPDVVDQRRQTLGRRADRRDPILGAVHDERRDVDLCDVAANVGQ
jgi:hypothetical protein